jgi:hypothetical protein
MTPKEKAEELFYKMLSTDKLDSYSFVGRNVAKQCALIAVEEMIALVTNYKVGCRDEQEYWQEVKQEIEKL